MPFLYVLLLCKLFTCYDIDYKNFHTVVRGCCIYHSFPYQWTKCCEEIREYIPSITFPLSLCFVHMNDSEIYTSVFPTTFPVLKLFHSLVSLVTWSLLYRHCGVLTSHNTVVLHGLLQG
jgi:hypothetical protein